MGLRLTTKARPFAPDVMLPTDEGMVSNRDAEALDKMDVKQVLANITMASIQEKQKYYATVTTTTGRGKNATITNNGMEIRYAAAVREHGGDITGLEDFGITTGRALVSYKAPKGEHRHPVIDEIIQEIFLKVTGGHIDDDGLEMPEKE